MNGAEVRMTFEEWGEVLRIAATIWPQSRSFFDDPPDARRTPTRTWWAALCRFETDDVLSGIGQLGMTSRYWPSLADAMKATREVAADRMERLRRSEQHGRARVSAPGELTIAERLAVFDHVSAALRQERSDELRRFAARVRTADGEVADAEALDTVGPWEQRLRGLIADGWPCTDTGETGVGAEAGQPDH